MKLHQLCAVAGVAGSIVAHLFGEYDMFLEALIAFMCLDYASGLLVALSHGSPKTEDGGPDSKVGFKGLCRKGMILLYIIAAHYVDALLGVDYVRNAVAIGFSANEIVSLVENGKLLKLNPPKIILDMITLMKKKAGEKEGE